MQNLLKKLIEFESVSGNSEELQNCMQFLGKYLQNALKLEVKYYTKNGVPSMIASKKIKKHYEYILAAHLDVVAGNYERAFKPYIKNSRLYGRGASDMKGPLVGMIEAFKVIIEKESNKTSRDIALMVTGDEETGGFNGTSHLLNDLGYHCKCAILPDAGNDFQLVLGEKGAMFIKLIAKGKLSHGSRPWEGENAIERVFELFSRIKKNFPEDNLDSHWGSTINLGKIHAGESINQVPNLAEAYIDVRFINEKGRKDILKSTEKACKNLKGTSYEIVISVDPSENSFKNKYINRFAKILIKNGPLETFKSHGGSDARFFSAKKIPVVICKPLASEQHIENEWINLKSLEKFKGLLVEYLS